MKAHKRKNSLKIIAIADTHKDYKNLNIPDGDIFIHTGDIDIMGYPAELESFNNWLGSLPHKHKIVIAGNHDSLLETWCKNGIRTALNNAIYLEDSGCTLEGFNFWGSPITPTFMNWFFMANRGLDIKKYWKKIPKETDVLITHGPPYGIMDVVMFPKGKHVGCEELLKTVKKIKPTLHIFGHIHSQHGIVKTPDTIFYNVSVMNEDYKIAYKPTKILMKEK